MKFLALFSVLFLSQAQAATVDDFKVDCKALAWIVSTSDPYYHPANPPRFRFPGSPAHAGFKAKIVLRSIEAGCGEMEDKYEISLSPAPIEVQVSLPNPVSLEESALLAKGAVQASASVNFTQVFFYLHGKTNLPLFPLIHGEKLFLTGEFELGEGKAGFSQPLPFSIEHVYGISPVESRSDEEKLRLGEKLLPFLANLGEASTPGDFGSLFLTLMPKSLHAKKAYAHLIWKVFATIKQRSPFFAPFFDFHVGGSSFFVGSHFATKLNELTHLDGILTTDEKVQLMVEFPTIILAGYSKAQCMNVSSDEVEQFLRRTLTKLPHATDVEKAKLKDPIQHLVGPVRFISMCMEGKLTPQGFEHAKEIQKRILK